MDCLLDMETAISPSIFHLSAEKIAPVFLKKLFSLVLLF